MKKLALFLGLTFSIFIFSQELKETSYIYKNITIVKNSESNTFKSPVTVTYFNQGQAVIKVNYKNKNYLYTIVTSPVKKYSEGLYYFQFNTVDGDGRTIAVVVFEQVGKYGCIFSDGDTALVYDNIEG